MAQNTDRNTDRNVDRYIDRYAIREPIGQGGMGVVYRAFDPRLRRQLAIKIVRGTGNSRLLHEARAMARLSHPGVVQVYDAGVVGDRVFIAMELIDGINAGQWLRAPRTWSEIVDHFIAAGRGLAAAHAVGIVHRDFKPSNVLVARNGRVVVGDFVLAHPVGGDHDAVGDDGNPGGNDGNAGDSTLTLGGPGFGTPRYMAPEQRSGIPVDARADQYSFCIALAEALAAANAPQKLREVVLRGLAFEPEARFPTMAALLAALEQARQAGQARPVPGSRTRTWLAATAAAAVIAVIALATPADSTPDAQPTSDSQVADSHSSDTPMSAASDFEPVRGHGGQSLAAPAYSPGVVDGPRSVPASAGAGGEQAIADADAPAKSRRAGKRVRQSKPQRRHRSPARAARRPEPDGLIRDLWGSD